MQTVNRDQSLGDRVLGAVRAVESLVHVGDWKAVGRGRSVDVVVHLVQIRFKSGKDSFLHVRNDIRIVDVHGADDGVVGAAQGEQLGDDGAPILLEGGDRSEEHTSELQVT